MVPVAVLAWVAVVDLESAVIMLAAVVLTIFIDLYPRVMVSSTSAANDLTVHNTSSSSYTLKV
jgi:cytochrome d ubiquinol oxidase subunit II